MQAMLPCCCAANEDCNSRVRVTQHFINIQCSTFKYLVRTELLAKDILQNSCLPSFSSFSQASGAVKKYQASDLPSVISAVSFPFPLLILFCLIVKAGESVSDHFQTVACCSDYKGLVI